MVGYAWDVVLSVICFVVEATGTDIVSVDGCDVDDIVDCGVALVLVSVGDGVAVVLVSVGCGVAVVLVSVIGEVTELVAVLLNGIVVCG